ncbi:MAG: protein kinase [Actinomycetota bacterium]
MSAPTPTVIAGRYELQRRLATGGMAEVWLAVDLTLDRKVAVKWLKPALASDEIVAERFRREAVAAASLNHPNIVAVHDVFEQEGRQAVVMQLVDGKSLRQLLDNQKRLSPELTCHIGQAVAGALDHAHAAGFVHRDVKPGNIMITPDGRVLLTDFGIAKGLQGEHGQDLTNDNIMMGTAKYLSPEQVRGKKLDGRADLYSLGLVLYECLAGRVPFLGETDADTALARLQRDPTDLARLRATLPRTLVDTIHELLARNPDKRPATGADLVADLKAAAAEGPPEFDETNPQRSPVTPFSAGRLLRAPSDLRGRAEDRVRGARTPTPPRGRRPARRRDHDERTVGPDGEPPAAGHTAPPPSGPVGIPGEPAIVTGQVPTVRTIPTGRPSEAPADRRPADAATGSSTDGPTDTATPPRPAPARSAPRRDDTPAAGVPLRGAPARGMADRMGPSAWTIGILLAIALVVAVVLWMAIEFGGGTPSSPTTVLPADAQADESADGPAAETEIDGAETATDEPLDDDGVDPSDPVPEATGREITGVVIFDPEGNQFENDDLAVAALADGDGSTQWVTECYSNRFMGQKTGVGLVVTFDAPVDAPVEFDVDSAPYNIDIYGSTDERPPSDSAGWGPPIRSAFAQEPGTIRVDLTTPVRHLLISLAELGPSSACSDTSPFRGVIDELALLAP